MALLVALDDGSTTKGETWRIRQTPFVIGRQSGDVVIPHDTEISSQHCEITCREENGARRWWLTDLESTNGTFLRAARVPLSNGLQILIGRLRYEYRSGTSTAAVRMPTESQQQRARNAEVAEATLLERPRPSLVELTPDGTGRVYWIPLGVDSVVGSGSGCGVQILGDPCVDRAHARITTDAQDRTFLENLDSHNGVWVRIHDQPIDQNCEFQAGEQRFLLRFP